MMKANRDKKMEDRWREKKEREEYGGLGTRAKSRKTSRAPKTVAVPAEYMMTCTIDEGTEWTMTANTTTASALQQENTELHKRIRDLERRYEGLKDSVIGALEVEPDEIIWVKCPHQDLGNVQEALQQCAKVLRERGQPRHIILTENTVQIEKLTPEQSSRLNLKLDIDFMGELSSL